MKYIVYILLAILPLHGGLLCRMNPLETSVEPQKMQTNTMIEGKKGELEDAIDEYKKALEKKKEMMTKLWKNVAKVEFLMKENQVLRKEIIKHWEDVKQSHISVQ